jgi:nucleoid DNA-binding protein
MSGCIGRQSRPRRWAAAFNLDKLALQTVCKKVGLSRTESAAFVELVLKEITDCLERGETVKLSSFGSFVVRKKGERVGRNPKTGKEVPISLRTGPPALSFSRTSPAPHPAINVSLCY